jgi:DNA invertase Pin-like site-specific DNA recombinase
LRLELALFLGVDSALDFWSGRWESNPRPVAAKLRIPLIHDGWLASNSVQCCGYFLNGFTMSVAHHVPIDLERGPRVRVTEVPVDNLRRTALYARVSTRDKGQEVENQLIQLREFASRQNWIVVEEFVDRESGSTADRVNFQAMFRAASQRKFEVLLFWSIDRLAREGVLETLQHLNRLTSYGVNYRSFTEQYFDSCGVFKDAVISILATIAKQERIRISERVRAGMRNARARGSRIGRPANIPLTHELRTQIAEAYLNRRGSLRHIAAQFGTSLGTVQRCIAPYQKGGSQSAAND